MLVIKFIIISKREMGFTTFRKCGNIRYNGVFIYLRIYLL